MTYFKYIIVFIVLGRMIVSQVQRFSTNTKNSSILSSFPFQRNEIELRRFEHKLLDKNYATAFTFDWRLVARNTITMNITFHQLRKTFQNGDVHVVLYRRYMRWQKYLVDVWENLCDVLDPHKFTPVMDIFYSNFKQFTNLRHPCPYRINETVYVYCDRVFFGNLSTPLIQSGSYRSDITLTDGKERHPILCVQMYFDISDHRVWQE